MGGIKEFKMKIVKRKWGVTVCPRTIGGRVERRRKNGVGGQKGRGERRSGGPVDVTGTAQVNGTGWNTVPSLNIQPAETKKRRRSVDRCWRKSGSESHMTCVQESTEKHGARKKNRPRAPKLLINSVGLSKRPTKTPTEIVGQIHIPLGSADSAYKY